MASFIKGNLFTIAKSGYIMHQVNCKDKMGAGVAKQFAAKYPQIKEQYHEYNKKTPLAARLGSFQQVELAPNLIGVNSFTQFAFGNSAKTKVVYTDEELLIRNLYRLNALAQANNTKAYIPDHIGCGLAGGDWNNIVAQLEHMDNIIVVALH